MVTQDDCFSPKAAEATPSSIMTIHLEPVLSRLLPGWNAINPQLFALKTRRAKFVDTTSLLVPFGTMTTEAAQILEAVALAAQSASEAAKALREANDQLEVAAQWLLGGQQGCEVSNPVWKCKLNRGPVDVT